MLLDNRSKNSKMNRRVLMRDLNGNLVCVLCGGYFIDATTIVECVHSFCRACIVKHFESSKYCPICEVMVHKTKPLLSLKRDKTLQDIVYKLVPGLFAREMSQRREYYEKRPHYVKPDDVESGGEVSEERKSYICDDSITLCLKYVSSDAPPWYLRCPVGVSIRHLKKLVKSKYGFDEDKVVVEVLLKDQILDQDLTLLDIACLFPYRSKEILEFNFVMLSLKQKEDDCASNSVDRSKTEEVEQTASANEVVCVVEKEVQLQITEAGVMSVSEIDTRPNRLIDHVIESITPVAPTVTSAAAVPVTSAPTILVDTTLASSAPTSTSASFIWPIVALGRKCSETATSTVPCPVPPASPSHSSLKSSEILSNPSPTPPTCSPMPLRQTPEKEVRKKRLSIEFNSHKPKRLAIAVNDNSSSQHEAVASSQARDPVEPSSNGMIYGSVESRKNSQNSSESSEKANLNPQPQPSSSSRDVGVPSTAPNKTPPPTPSIQKPQVTSPKTSATSHSNLTNSKELERGGRAVQIADKATAGAKPGTSTQANKSATAVSTAKPHTKHKAIRSTPEPWRPVITKEKLRPTLMSNSDEPKKQGKFFKMRNMPRFLGNPASGVKPMYTNGLSPPSTTPLPSTPPKKIESIIRIDPKTLRPFQKEEKKSPNMIMTNPFIPRDCKVMLPDPKTQPYGHFPPGFHASLPPSISLLLNPHQHFRNLKAREDAAKHCDSSQNPRPIASSSKPTEGESVGGGGGGNAPPTFATSAPVSTDPVLPSANCA